MRQACGSPGDRLGQTVGDRFVLHEVVGAGGTSVVYRASTETGDEVAIKILHDYLSSAPEVRSRFIRESRLGNLLEHSGVVRVLDHGMTSDDCPFLVLEMLEGESLEERRVRLGGRLSVDEALEYCDQLLDVLELAHARNIVHRDIKPSNVFVTSSGKLKVLDFGIARLEDVTNVTKTGHVIGTPAFMSPEQALSRPSDVDLRTDLWAVGATLFTLLSGELVHSGDSNSADLVRAATLHARPLSQALPDVPANVDAFVARCLSFAKTDRWPSAAAMRAALADLRAARARRAAPLPTPDALAIKDDAATLVHPKPKKRRKRRRKNRAVPALYPEDRLSRPDGTLPLSPPRLNAHEPLPRRRWLIPVCFVAATLLAAAGFTGVYVHRLRAARARASAPPPIASASIDVGRPSSGRR